MERNEESFFEIFLSEVYVCVCLGFGREGEREKKRETLIRYLLGNMGCMHGNPTNKDEVAQRSTLPFLWAWAENGEGRESFWALKA